MKRDKFIKICGLTRRQDVEKVIELGADAIGFVAFPPSPRYVSPVQVAELCRLIPPEVLKVLVVVDASLKEIAAYVEAGINVVQLHGNETAEFAQKVPVPCWRALRLRSTLQIDQEKNFPCDVFVVDSFVKDSKIPGGTGHVADWPLTKQFISVVTCPVLLAGGIHSGNAHKAGQEVGPWGFDLSSGVEDSPGIKSHKKLEEFFNALDSC